MILRECAHEKFLKMMGIRSYLGVFYIVFKRVMGHNLREIIYNPRINKLYEKKNIVCQQVCLGTIYIHGHHCNIIHRDIEPDVILVHKKYKTVKICDLGVSKISELLSLKLFTTKKKPQHAGTEVYMSPERLIDHTDATKASDICSLSCSLAEFTKKNISGMMPMDTLSNQ